MLPGGSFEGEGFPAIWPKVAEGKSIAEKNRAKKNFEIILGELLKLMPLHR
jgi:hypothetical protein